MKKLSFENKIKLIPKICSIVGFFTSATLLLIWLVYPELKGFSATSLKANTALGLMFASLALFFLKSDPQDSPRFHLKLGYGFSLIILLLGIATLSQYLFGIELRIDELLATDFRNSESSLYPGRMSPLSAILFILAGLSLLFINLRHGRKLHSSAISIIALLLISKFALIGYVFGEDAFYKFGPYIRISWISALCFYLLAIGVLFSRPENGPVHVLTSQGLGGMTARRLLPVVIFVPLLLGWLRLQGQYLGYFDLEFGLGLLTISLMIILMGVVAVTAKKLDSLELEGSELSQREQSIKERFIEVLTHAPLIVWALDKEGIYTLSEGKALEHLKLNQSEVVGKRHSEIHQDSPSAVEHVQRALKGEIFTGEAEIQGRVYSTNYVPTLNSLGEVVGISAVSIDITNIKQTERALAESETKFRTIADAMPQMVWSTLPDGFHDYYNKRWYEFTGAPNGSTDGKKWNGMFHPEDQDRASKTWEKSLETGEPYEIEYRLRNHSGVYRWTLGRALAIRNETGEIIRWMGTCTDIHEQKLYEHKILEIIETMGDAFFSVDKDWLITQVNHNQEIISKIPKAESLGKSFWELFPTAKDPNSLYSINFQRVMNERVAVEFEDYYEPLNIWTAVNAYPTSNDGMAVFFRDISLKKTANNLIEKEKQKFEAIFVDSPALMTLLKGPTFIFEKVNRKYQELFGERQLLGKTFEDALPELEIELFNYLTKVLETGEAFSATEMLVRLARGPGGELQDVYFDFSYTRVLDGDGKPYGIYVHAVDVTEKVMARRSLEKSSSDLREAIRARDEFLSIASHELKTPLTSLKLQAQLFLRDVKKGDESVFAKERVTQIFMQTDKQTTRITRLVDDMLDVARIRSGKLSVEREEFDLCELVNESIERLKSQFSGKEIPELSGETKVIGSWDKFRIEQVVTNLFTNAIRYGDGKPVKVEIKNLKDSIILTVTDQGIGIEKEAHTKIFDRFERAINANEVSGLGLGLFITKQIVVAHGGKIWVESEVGLGSTFFVELPKKATDSSTEVVNVL